MRPSTPRASPSLVREITAVLTASSEPRRLRQTADAVRDETGYWPFDFGSAAGTVYVQPVGDTG